jgi:hypothetical protein
MCYSESDLDYEKEDDDDDDDPDDDPDDHWEWFPDPPTTTQRRVSNIIRKPAGVLTTMPINTSLDAFNQFMCSTIKKIAVENTNKSEKAAMNNNRPNNKPKLACDVVSHLSKQALFVFSVKGVLKDMLTRKVKGFPRFLVWQATQ